MTHHVDVSYYVKKKQGFPSISDLGVADIFMGGQGFSFKVKMATADAKDRQHFFKIEKIDVDVKNLNVNLKQSKHKLAFKIFKPLLFRVLRPVIQKVLEKQIRDTVTQADAMLYSIHEEAQRNAKASDPTSIQNFYSRYYEAAQSRFLKGKEKTKETAQDKKVNIAVTQQDSIFPHIKLPGGISTKATEYKELAAKGDKWESPVFSIGSAKESTNLPKIDGAQRRTQGGGVGSGRHPGGTSATGFSNQVDQSFGTQQDLSLGQGNAARANGTLNGTSDYPTGAGATSGYSTGAGATSGYSTGTGAGAGAGATSGYSTGTGTGATSGYPTGTGSGMGTTSHHPTGTATASDYPATSGTGVATSSGGTFLGASNPVLQGAA